MPRTWTVPRLWRNETVFILGGGPSLLDQLGVPPVMAEDCLARRRSIADVEPWARWLHKQNVIAINTAFKLGTWIPFCFFQDPSFYREYRDSLLDWPGCKITTHPAIPQDFPQDGLVYLPKNSRKHEGVTADQTQGISWNQNTGLAAINLTLYLGGVRVILLGFDMKPDSHGRTHHHGFHPQKSPWVNGVAQNPPLQSYLDKIPLVKQEAGALGLEIINCSPDSAIQEFPRLHLSSVLDPNGNLRI